MIITIWTETNSKEGGVGKRKKKTLDTKNERIHQLD